MGKSFYGGMDGRPFILKKVYPTIPNMINMFKNEINYGEYVLISNENRNHPDNGKLFKRVYAAVETDKIEYSFYNENTHSFEKTVSTDVEMKYIGAIVGPQGSALEFKLFDKNKGLNELKDLYEDSEFIQTNSELVLSPDVNKKELFPGKPGSVVTLKAYSFRDKNGNKSTVYLDVSMPYNVIEWKTTQLTSQDQVRILDDDINPFYQWYELGIPKGQDGTSFNNIRVITPTAADDVVTISFDEDRNITATKYDGLQDDIDNQRQIWVADVTDYKVTDNGIKYLVYLGDYNIINGASIEHGHLDITTGHKENEIHEQLNWPIKIAIDPEDGTVTYTDVEVDENNNHKTYSQDSLTWIKDLTIDEKGVLNTITTTGKNQIENQQLNWVKNISINPDTGIVTYTDISGDTTTEILDWVKNLDIDEEGTITVDYTNSENKVIDKLIDWIKEVSISQDGTVSIESNNGTQLLSSDQQNLKWLENVSLAQDGTFTKTDNQNVSVNQEEKLKWVDGVSLSQDGTFTQSYNNGETTPQQAKQLKWMENIQIADDGIVTKVYNHGDNDTNTKLKWPVNISLDKNTGVVTTTYNDGSTESSQNPQMDWITSANLDDNKMLSVSYVNAENIKVNLKTPNEVTLDDASGDIYVKYNTGESIAIGNIGENMNIMSACAASEEEGAPETLKAGGIWFVTQDAE